MREIWGYLDFQGQQFVAIYGVICNVLVFYIKTQTPGPKDSLNYVKSLVVNYSTYLTLNVRM